MSRILARTAGSALIWKGVQLSGVKGVFLLRTLVLAWLLVPEDFGLLAICMMALAFMTKVTNFGMLPALVHDVDASQRDYDAAWTMGIIRALVVSIVLFLSAPLVAALFAQPQATDLIRMIALYPLLEAAVNVKLAELHRNLRFAPIALMKLSEALANTIVAVALASTFGVRAVVFGALTGVAVQAVASYVLVPYKPRIRLSRAATLPLIRYGRWVFIRGLLGVAGNFALRLSVSRQLGVDELGLYFFASRIAFLPLEIANEIIQPVAFPLYVRLRSNAARMAAAFRSVLIGASALLVPISFLMFALAPSLVAHVLDPRWGKTVTLIQVFACINVISLFGETVVPLFMGTGDPQKVALLQAVQLLVLLLSLTVLMSNLGVLGAAVSYAVAIGVSQFIAALLIRKILPRPLAHSGKALFAIVLASGLGVLVALTVDRLVSGLAGFLLASMLSIPVTALTLWILDRRLELSMTRDLVRLYPQIRGLPGMVRD